MDQRTTHIPVQYDPVATIPGGSVSVDMVSAEELKQNLIAAEMFFMEKARQEQAIGNASLAQELRAAAEYTGECIKIFGQTAASQFSKDTIELFTHSPIAEMLQMRPQQSSAHQHEAEQKYKDMGQELCAKAGCKSGSLLSQIYIAAITHGIGKTIQSLPPISPAPQAAVLVGADGVAVVPVADTVANATQVAQAGKLAGGLALMSGQSGPDNTGSHEQVPQQQAPVDEKVSRVSKSAEDTKQWATEVEKVAEHNNSFKT